jgi:tetratricopeptide (TPR) repeat protein
MNLRFLKNGVAALIIVAVLLVACPPRPGRVSQPTPTAAIDALRDRAAAHLQAKEWPEAVSALEQWVQAAPDAAEALYRLALLVAPYDPQTAQSYLSRAAQHPGYAGPAGAVRERLASLDDEPDRAFANARLALLLIELEAWDMAGLALEQALLVNPRYAEAQAYLGLVRAHQGELDEGFELAWDAVQEDPESALVRYALGRLYVMQGDDDSAVPVLLQAAALDPRCAIVAAELGSIYRARGDLEAAARWLWRATQLEPESVPFWEALATFYADLLYNLDTEGRRAVNLAAVRAPDSAEVHASLGWVLYQSGEYEAASLEIETALSLDPTSPRAMYYGGVMREVRGDFAAAAALYRAVIDAGTASGFARLAERGLGRVAGE